MSNGRGQIEHTRPSYTPSYMASTHLSSSAKSSNPSSVESRPHGASQRPVLAADSISKSMVAQNSALATGLMVVIIAGPPHKSTIAFLETILNQQSLADIALLANECSEAAVKQLKMDVYALVGRLRMQVGVHVILRETWTEASIHESIEQAMASNNVLQGVLCCPEYENAKTSKIEILDLSQSSLEQSWKQSVGFVHASSKACIRRLLSRSSLESNGKPKKANGATVGKPFFMLADPPGNSATSVLVRSACHAIIGTLRNDFKRRRLDALLVGHAEVLLPPVAPRIPQGVDVGSGYSNGNSEREFAAGESPTKLWNMWSQANGIE